MIELTTDQISQYLNLSKRTIQRRSIKEAWHFELKTGVSGVRKIYTYDRLPYKTKQKITAAIIVKHENLGLNYHEPGPTLPISSNLFDIVSLSKLIDVLMVSPLK